jgi:3'-phosphoadenosine 5'-phosphosulfate sulfotransferase (PAPS reductase)/FAD synthetase
MNPFSRHEKVVLQFSGGKDSLACLYLLKDFWDRMTVMWVNTGNAFPETIAQMEKIRALVPHFMEVKSDQPACIARDGPVSDVLPIWSSQLGRAIGGPSIPVQSSVACCAENIWFPAQNAVVAMGATLVIRGQRNQEARKGPVRSGQVIDGIEYWFPLQDWARIEVMAFLANEGVELPEQYNYVDTSLDCMTCTAYLDENEGKFTYMKEKHPELYIDVQNKLGQILSAVSPDLDALLKVYKPEPVGEENG